MPRPKILAYYFPGWHQDPRNAEWFGQGWDEWSLVESAGSRFQGHRQPRTPLHGPFDEATPAAASAQIELARNYGVDGFLVDYYWYDDGPYLQRALDEGLLAAGNSRDVEFALMWANHELVDIFPHDHPGNAQAARLKNGAIGRESFEEMVRHIIPAYLSRPNYLTVEGRPWFTIYDLANFVVGMGGTTQAVEALTWFDDHVKQAGFPGIHLNAVLWKGEVLPTSAAPHAPIDLVRQLGFRSATSYVWVHHADLSRFSFPAAEIAPLRDSAFAEYEKYAVQLDIPFYPNVTVGWDPSPRTQQTEHFQRGRYPWTPVWDPTPEEFKEGLLQAKAFVDRHDSPHPFVTINAWNEWTEGSALLPDTFHRHGFLEAIRDVFGSSDDKPKKEEIGSALS